MRRRVQRHPAGRTQRRAAGDPKDVARHRAKCQSQRRVAGDSDRWRPHGWLGWGRRLWRHVEPLRLHAVRLPDVLHTGPDSQPHRPRERLRGLGCDVQHGRQPVVGWASLCRFAHHGPVQRRQPRAAQSEAHRLDCWAWMGLRLQQGRSVDQPDDRGIEHAAFVHPRSCPGASQWRRV
jgi:hypothetical protein